jgi:hypothetical protein
MTLDLIIFILLFSTALAAATYLYGQTILLKRVLVQNARDKNRLLLDLKLWQNVVVRSRGLGGLAPQRGSESDKPPRRATNVVAPTQVIGELKAEADKRPAIKSETLPPHVKQRFRAAANQLNGDFKPFRSEGETS